MKNNKKNNKDVVLNRRDLLIAGMLSGGGIGLRSLMTGLPVHFLTQRSMAAAGGTFLVYCGRSSGDPVNCNVPGTYKTGYDHSEEFRNPVDLRIGTQVHKAASAWNTLNADIKKTANFFHLHTLTNSHNEMDSVSKIFGAIEPIEGRTAEMLPSMIAYEMSKMLGTSLDNPIAMQGPLQFKGRTQTVYRPTDITSLFPTGLSDARVNARKFRDQLVDSTYRDIKTNGTPAQKRFLANHAISGDKAKELGDQLAQALNGINGNGTDDKMRTAAALLALKVTPVVTMGLDFGGDNHGDTNLTNETNKHKSSIASINLLYEALKGYGIEDKTIFSLMNVFGRTPTVNGRGGRDHHGQQSIMFSFGNGIKGGMIGDLMPSSRRGFQSSPLNSQTGRVENPDIDHKETLHSAAKSLMVATGISESKVNKIVTGGKVVKAYLK